MRLEFLVARMTANEFSYQILGFIHAWAETIFFVAQEALVLARPLPKPAKCEVTGAHTCFLQILLLLCCSVCFSLTYTRRTQMHVDRQLNKRESILFVHFVLYLR